MSCALVRKGFGQGMQFATPAAPLEEKWKGGHLLQGSPSVPSTCVNRSNDAFPYRPAEHRAHEEEESLYQLPGEQHPSWRATFSFDWSGSDLLAGKGHASLWKGEGD